MKTNHHHRTPPFVPLLVELPGPAVVFGGGSVGMRKAAVLASAHVDVVVVDATTRAVPAGVRLLCMHVTDASFKECIPEDASLVVCALDDTQLNARITTYCRMQGILVTNASEGEQGTALFPNVTRRGPYVAAVSSSGTSPLASYAMRRLLEARASWLLPFGELVSRLSAQGPLSKERIALFMGDESLLVILATGDVDAAVDYVEGGHGDC